MRNKATGTFIRAVKRQSSQTKLERDGAMLHLECGHKVWHGGATVVPAEAECLTGPCYRPVRYCGK